MVVTHATERIKQPSLKERLAVVERVLAASGLPRGPRGLWPRAVPRPQEDQARTLRRVLESLGPVFSSFGLYLASRVDLLSGRDCLEFAEIRDTAEPLTPDIVVAVIQRELGRPPDDLFTSVETTPFESRLLFQKHYARLKDGRKATIKIARAAETEERLIEDLELLPLVKFALGSISTHAAIDSAIDDFRFTLSRKIDLTHEANGLEALSRYADTFGILSHVSVEHRLCTQRILTVERLPGTGLTELLTRCSAAEAEDLARRLCVVWLRQTLHSNVFPVEMSPADIVVLPGRQLGFTGGVFTNLPEESRSNLWSYLIAAAGDSPNQACALLVRELKKSEPSSSDSELQQRFRQVVPFRDTDWAGDFFADHLFVQWKLAHEHGYLPRQSLPSFFRGLYSVAQLARQLSPERDAFAQALEDVRLITRMEWFKDMLGPDQFSRQMNQYAALILELPQRLDEALTLVAEDRTQMRERHERRGRQNSSAIMVALVLVLGAFVLLVQRAGVTTWNESLKALAFVVLGACVLRVASRA
jgi:ubiquinone biosynthesis protein